MVNSGTVNVVWKKLLRILSAYALPLASLAVLVLSLAVVVGWFLFPTFLNRAVKSKINLGPGTESRKRWVQMPVLNFDVYLFNITNPSEVMRGAKPAVQEVGPYCFKEVKEKLDISDDSAEDTVSYRSRSSFFSSQQDPSCPAPRLTGQEPMVVPHIPMMAILLIAEKDYPSIAMPLVNQALPHLFGKVSDVFLRTTAKDLLFGGVLIDCSSESVLAYIVCDALKKNSRGLKRLENDRYSFSFFGAKNASSEQNRYTIKRGTRDSAQVGKLVAVNNKQELQFWRGNCNTLEGTDASIFPPFRQKDDRSLTLYSSEVCRVIRGVFEGEFNFKGVTGYAFSATFGNAEDNPGDRCFCPSEKRCFKRGVLDAYKCQGAPLVTSLPHFYEASPYYVDRVTGLRPDKAKHGIFVVLEPMIGTPLMVRKRVQLNLDIKPIPFVPATEGLQRTLVPLFWAEESLDLDSTLMDLLDASLFRPIRIVDFIKWFCILVGVLLLASVIFVKLVEKRKGKVNTLEGKDNKIGTDFKFSQHNKY